MPPFGWRISIFTIFHSLGEGHASSHLPPMGWRSSIFLSTTHGVKGSENNGVAPKKLHIYSRCSEVVSSVTTSAWTPTSPNTFHSSPWSLVMGWRVSIFIYVTNVGKGANLHICHPFGEGSQSSPFSTHWVKDIHLHICHPWWGWFLSSHLPPIEWGIFIFTSATHGVKGV